jgi:antitoxin component of MazEF toxin-antitoxin module
MATLNVSKRGVVMLPKELLQHIGVQPGEKIELTLLPDGQIEFRAARPKGRIGDLAGFLAGKTNGKVLTVEEITSATAEAAAAEVMESFNR